MNDNASPWLEPIVLGILLLSLWLAVALYEPSPPPNAGAISDHIGPSLPSPGDITSPIVGGGDKSAWMEPVISFVWHLEQPPVQMPAEMAWNAYSVFWCESRFRDSAVGLAGELGVPQISPIHRPAMAKAGLDFEDGRDRMQWAINLFEKHAWRPWSCRP